MKINTAVFFGGRSVEHEVSVITGVQAMMSLDREKYNVIPVYIAKDGTFYSGDVLFDIDNYKDLNKLCSNAKRVAILAENGKAVMKFAKRKGFSEKNQVELDVALPAVHGTNCEDGALQGFFELLDLAYVGPDVLSSAVGMDKAVFKKIMQANGLPVVPGVEIVAREYAQSTKETLQKIESSLGYPVIVKPVNLGSSVGISKANDEGELSAACELAFSFADRLLIEKAVQNLKEINCSVLGDCDDCSASVCESPAMSGDILSYDDKYTSGSKSKGMASLARQLPADIDDAASDKIRSLAKAAFKAMGAAGVCRIDFLMDTVSGDIYINEANTIPGSLSFYLWEATNMKYTEMLDKLIEVAYKRKRRNSKLMHTVDVNLLSCNALSGNKFSKTGKLGK